MVPRRPPGPRPLMHEIQTIVRNRHGLHARPAHLVVQTAQRFDAKVLLMKGGFVADAESMMMLMALAPEIGEEITICADGPDERAAAEAIADLFERGFEEE